MRRGRSLATRFGDMGTGRPEAAQRRLVAVNDRAAPTHRPGPRRVSVAGGLLMYGYGWVGAIRLGVNWTVGAVAF